MTALLIVALIISGQTYPVVQQYGNGPLWVSRLPDTLTQFNRGEGLGFLAHSWLAGAAFYKLSPGDIVMTVDETGGRRQYRVTGVYRYQQIGPDDYTSLDNRLTYTGPEVLDAMYPPGELTLQTCIAFDGVDDWGRLFVHAKPMPVAREK